MLRSGHISRAIARLKQQWQAFRQLPPGERFQIHYREQRRARAAKSGFTRALSVLLVPLLFAVGVVLMFIPGPAILFFFLGAALLASHSLWVARALDGLELELRVAAIQVRIWWKQSSVAHKLPVFLAALVIVGGSVAAIQLFAAAR